MHFNNDIIWSAYKSNQSHVYNLFKVAAHYIGHSLGLYHSENNSQSIMYSSTYQPESKVELDPEDIAKIQALYPPQNIYLRPQGFDGHLGLVTGMLYRCMYIRIYIFLTNNLVKMDQFFSNNALCIA